MDQRGEGGGKTMRWAAFPASKILCFRQICKFWTLIIIILPVSTSYEGTHIAFRNHFQEIAGFIHVKNDDWQLVFHAKSEGCHVHYPQVFRDAFLEGDGVEFFSVRVFFRVGSVYTINASTLSD